MPERNEALDQLVSDPGGRVLVRGATIVSMDDQVGDLPRGDILIDGSRIEAIGPDLSTAANVGQAVVVDAAGCIAIPGFVDGHRHCWQTQIRRYLSDAVIAEYNDLLHFRLAPIYGIEDMAVGTELAALGALDSGVTCILDFSHNMRSPEYSDTVVRTWQESGIRAVLASCAPLGGEWDQTWRSDFARVRAEHFPSDDSLVTLRMGLFPKVIPELHGDVCLTAEAISEARELGVGVTVDGALGPVAAAEIRALGDELGPDLTWIHCGGFDDETWKVLVGTGGRIVLAVTSDQQLGIGGSIAPIQETLDAGLRPGLSVDVECSLTTDMFTQMQVLLNTQRMHAGNRRFRGEADAPAPLTVRDALEFATAGSAKANGVWDRCGSLTPGKEADLVLIDADAINTIPLNNAVATVVLGSDSRNVDTVFVAGQPRKWAGKLVSGDTTGLRSRVVASRDRILERIGHRLDITA
ncbi:amidohydrolase family protein [Amycolatopsis jejuensis]|uniref:amidohydrolase family protein n=1 Tax=Amycolatopsis jejuensis TaxID=330084 RepID=UPI000523F69B|nr:amidohydrolase family protein [Amycolatopsis jejuensis]